MIQRLLTRFRGPAMDGATRALIRFNRRKWKPQPKTDNVVLMGLFSWRPTMCAFSHAANHFAERTGARIEAYFFGRGMDPVVLEIYRSFGARLTLGWSSTTRHEAQARQFADEALAAVRNSDDVFLIRFQDIVLGDLIYDSYIRYFYEATVRLDDPRLREIVEKTFLIALACEEYFARHRVTALFPYDAPYIESGVVHRFAIRHGVPIYALEYHPFALHAMDTAMLAGDPADHRHWPSKLPLHRFAPEIFAGLDPEQQARGQEAARAALARHFQGIIADKVLAQYGAPATSQGSAFSEPGSEAVFAKTGRPRMLVMLHDFCDAPNVYRWALFRDFDEWLEFLLTRAAQTDFDWYVKPHPNRHYDRRMNEANDRITAELQRRYPHVHFLSPQVSNRQILAEGLDAMFTVFGTSAHEFAYHGVPVVTAGDNPQIDYTFNFHPRTREEYARLIRSADRLQIDIDRADIEKFYYLYHFHPYDRLPSGVSILPEEWLRLPNLGQLESSTESFRHFMKTDSPARDRKIADYIDAFLAAQATAAPSSPPLVTT